MITKKSKLLFVIAAILLIVFIAFTYSTKTFDVAPIGPLDSEVGYSSINGAIDAMLLKIDILDPITDVIILFSYALVGVFGLHGLVQWIKRKNLFKVDHDILAMGSVFILSFAAYFLFEKFSLNYAPILDDNGALKSSYPSSHTYVTFIILISVCVMISKRELFPKIWRRLSYIAAGFLCVFMSVARLLCKAHWFTDILASFMLAGFLLSLYFAALDIIYEKQELDKRNNRKATHLQENK